MHDLKLYLRTYNVYVHVTLMLSVETAARDPPPQTPIPFNVHRVFKLSYAVCVSMVSTAFVEVLVQAICL